MTQARTMFFLRSENNQVFDGSNTGTSPQLIGKATPTAVENELLLSGGYIELGTIYGLNKVDSFTLEATVTPKKVLGARQNILESQSPSVALFIDDKGFPVASVHTKAGWVTTVGKFPLIAGKSNNIRFSRNDKGVHIIELNNKIIAQETVQDALVDVGKLGFRAGAGMDGKAYKFTGNISDVQIRAGAFTNAIWSKRVEDAAKLEKAIKTKIGGRPLIRVIPSLDESQMRLMPIKDIMNAAGVDKLSDLDTLRITAPVSMTRGKVLVASKKANKSIIDWGKIAKDLKNLKVDDKKIQLAKFLPNRNSIIEFNKVLPKTPISPITPIVINPIIKPIVIDRRFTGRLDMQSDSLRTGVRLPRAVIANSATLAANRLQIPLNKLIDINKSKLTIIDKDLLPRLEKKKPEDWPVLENNPVAMAMQNIPISQSVIIAGILDLTNTTLTIEANVEKLIIIAERVICGPNAKITWRKPTGSTPNRQNDAGLNGRGWSGIHTKPNSRDGLDGDDARAGSTGINGASGIAAPAIELWVKDLTNIPNIDLSGQPGVLGGKGQTGGRGGNGANGEGGKRAWFFGWHCTSDPGDGGNGGDGGQGGNGGRGGNGGNGGNITIGVLDGTLANTVTANSFRLNNSGGVVGQGGAGGNGGAGGTGGRSGNGETCHDGRNGHNGQLAQPGSTGLAGSQIGIQAYNNFFQFTEDAWDELLTRPFITELNPVHVFPGNTITIRGSRFANNDRVIVEGGFTLIPIINADESITVTIPSTITGGQKSIYLRRAFDNTESNRLLIRIKPQLDVLPALLPPATTIFVSGKAFVNGASVLINGNAIPAIVASRTSLNFTMPGTGGSGSSGGNVTVEVRNPDGLVSNARSAAQPLVLEIPFTYGVHNLPFNNFTDGIPSWSTYEDTFGAAEVWHEQLDPVFGHPVLTAAFYGFYNYFLKGSDNGGLATGFCTSLASLVADKLWKGETNAITTAKADVHELLTAVHGKLLSRESLIYFHDQSRQGIARVEKTAREIERIFLTGCDRNNAPLIFFIPSGAIWDAGYIDGLSSSHCLMPYRFVYPQGHTGPQLSAGGTTTINSLDGVEMYCWDCNHADNDQCRIKFRLDGGVLHYDYFDGGTDIQFSSSNNITLGMMTNGDYLLADHDLPFSGPFGLTSFIIDFLLSPADLEITDEDGLRVGNFNNQIFSEVADSHPCYLVKGAYLLPANRSYTRNIVGNGTGTYTYNSIMPDGTTIKIENVSTKLGHRDVLMVNADASGIRFAPQIEKQFTMTFSKLVGTQLRSVAISGVGGGPSTETDITISPDLSVLRLGNRSSLKNVEVKAFSLNSTNNTPINTATNMALPKNHDLVVAIENWNTAALHVEALAF